MSLIEKYTVDHSSGLNPACEWIIRETNIKTNHSRMLSGRVLGKLLETISKMISPNYILEIGTFTGFSTICLAAGLQDEGHIDTIEINPEQEDIIEEGISKSGLKSKITVHYGDAKLLIPKLDREYDLIFIDGNKREYLDYFKLCKPKLKKGGYIIADNVLWDGKVLDEINFVDKQSKSIIEFNKTVKSDEEVEVLMLPIRDGVSIIKKLK